jgi:hypothetical protein
LLFNCIRVCTVDSKYYQIISNMIISSCKGL